MVRETFSVAGGRGPGASVCVSVRWWRGKGGGGRGKGGTGLGQRGGRGWASFVSETHHVSSQRHSNTTPSLPHPPAHPPSLPRPRPPSGPSCVFCYLLARPAKTVYCYFLARPAKYCVLLRTGKASQNCVLVYCYLLARRAKTVCCYFLARPAKDCVLSSWPASRVKQKCTVS